MPPPPPVIEVIEVTIIYNLTGVDVKNEVVLALEPVSAKWKEIGIILGAKYNFLDELYLSDEKSIESIKSIVNKWLKGNFDERFGDPSWKKLVEAIGAKTGAANSAHAQEIAQQHPSKLPEAKKPCPGGAGTSTGIVLVNWSVCLPLLWAHWARTDQPWSR